jgi:hypothetical protein
MRLAAHIWHSYHSECFVYYKSIEVFRNRNKSENGVESYSKGMNATPTELTCKAVLLVEVVSTSRGLNAGTSRPESRAELQKSKILVEFIRRAALAVCK